MKVRVCAVHERSGKILCMKYIYGGKEVFSLPGGGAEKDIPIKEIIIKEWKEELDIQVSVGDVLLIGEAPAQKQHPQTLHIVFEAKEISGIPRLQPDATQALEIVWVPIDQLSSVPLYPDVGNHLHAYFAEKSRSSIHFINHCMERGFW